MGSSYREKIKNAYLLFYERVEHFDEAQFQKTSEAPKKEESNEEKEENGETALRSKIIETTVPNEEEDFSKNVPQDFLQQLIEKNQIFHMRKYIFSREHFDFIIDLVMQREFKPNLVYTEHYRIDAEKYPKEYYDLEVLKLGVLFVLTAVLRDHNKSPIIKFLPFLKRQLAQNVPACLFLLELFTSPKVQQEFWLDCPVNVITCSLY